jgi:hypothetical protein
MWFLHIEIDRWPEGDGIDVAGLRQEWDEFLGFGQAMPLTRLISPNLRSSGIDTSITASTGWSPTASRPGTHTGRDWHLGLLRGLVTVG